MNATIIHKPNVKESVLDELAKELPAIIAGVMQVLGVCRACGIGLNIAIA